MPSTTEFPSTHWQPLALEWHRGFAFLDGELLVGELGCDTYIMLMGARESAAQIAERGHQQGYPGSPLEPSRPLLQHRGNHRLLTDTQAFYYRLPHYDGRYGFQVLQTLPWGIEMPLQALGADYWRDRSAVYFCGAHALLRIEGVAPGAFHAVSQTPLPGGQPLALYSDGSGLYLAGQRVADACTEVRGSNSPAYQVVDGVVCRFFRPLQQKDGSPLPIANPSGFRMLADRWACDGQSIIVQAQQGSSVAYEYFYRIDDADLASFEVLNQRYARDARHAYYVTGKRIRSEGSFRLLERLHPRFDECGRAQGASCDTDEYFAVDARHVYAAGVRLRGADGATFRSLGFDFYRDAQRVYQRKQPLDLDVDSLVFAQLWRGEYEYSPLLVGDRRGPLGSQGVIDAEMVEQWAPFFEAHPQLTGYWWHQWRATATRADVDDGERHVLGHGFELGEQVYFHGRLVSGLDASSFRLLDTHLCGDANGLYLIPYHNPEHALPERFSLAAVEHYRHLGGSYLSDGQWVYCHDVFYHWPTPMPRADLPSFQDCGHGWAKDRRAVYYYGQAKKGLDPERVRILGNFAFVPGLMLASGKPLAVEFDPDEVSVPHPDFLQLGTRKLFCGRRPISARRIDLASLRFIGERHARDGQRCFRYDGHARLDEISQARFDAETGPAATVMAAHSSVE